MVTYPRVHSDPCLAKIFMGGRQTIRSREFVLEAGGRAVLALFANNIEHAQTFCSQSWFWDELATYRSSGCLLFDSNSELKIRHANPCEAADCTPHWAWNNSAGNMTGLSLRFWCLWMPTCSDVEAKTIAAMRPQPARRRFM